MGLTLPRNEVLVLSSKRAGLQRPQDRPPQEGPSPTFALIASFRWASTSSADSGGLREVSALPPPPNPLGPSKGPSARFTLFCLVSHKTLGGELLLESIHCSWGCPPLLHPRAPGTHSEGQARRSPVLGSRGIKQPQPPHPGPSSQPAPQGRSGGQAGQGSGPPPGSARKEKGRSLVHH